MEYIERPKEVNKSEAGVQSNEYIQKNMQTQINKIYDYLDMLKKNFDNKIGSSNIVISTNSIETNQYIQTGNMCVLQLILENSSTILASTKTKIASGFPKPKTGIQFLGGTSDGYTYRFFLDTAGDLYAYYTSQIPTSRLVITLTYITKEGG